MTSMPLPPVYSPLPQAWEKQAEGTCDALCAELATVWVATRNCIRDGGVFGFGGAGDRGPSLSFRQYMPEHSPSLTQAALWGVWEALCKSSHESALNLPLPPQLHCGKGPGKIICLSWLQISGSQAVSSSLIHLPFPLFPL